MLEFYVESDVRLRQLRQCPVGGHIDGFADWLRSAGYKRRPGQLVLRGAAHLGHWISAHGVPTHLINEEVLDGFARHLPTCACHTPFKAGIVTTGKVHAACSRTWRGSGSGHHPTPSPRQSRPWSRGSARGCASIAASLSPRWPTMCRW